MAIVVKIKATKVVGKSKQDVLNKITGYSIWNRSASETFTSNGSFLVKRDRQRNDTGLVRLYSLEKHNRKVKVTKRLITRGKRKGEVDVTREVVRTSQWIAHYYELPQNMIDTTATRQGNRTFKLKLK